MPAVAVQGQTIFHAGNHAYVLTRFLYNASAETVSVPVGVISAAALTAVSGDTAPTVSVSAGATNDTVTLTGGTTGKGVILVTRHSGGLSVR